MLIKIAKLIFPPRCIFCGNFLELNKDIDICDSCYSRIPFNNNSLIKMKNNILIRNFCDDVICLCYYSDIIRDSIIRYKFFNKSGYYRTFAKILSDKLKKMTIGSNFDIIIGVPLNKQREYLRGYNQSYLISRTISKDMRIPEGSYLLERVKDTKVQSLLAGELRYENVNEAFRVTCKEKIKDKSIILIDDILTTGYTIGECCRVLKEAGAKKVIVAVIASGKKY